MVCLGRKHLRVHLPKNKIKNKNENLMRTSEVAISAIKRHYNKALK
jgi:hypothetical protein